MPRAPPWKEKQAQYLQRCSDRMLSSQTLITYRAALNYCYQCCVALEWPANPSKLEPDHIRELYMQMLDAGMSTATQSLYTIVLIDFLTFCGNVRCKDARLRISVSRTNVNWLSELDVSTILGAAKVPQLLAALVLMSYCGLRREEVTDLRWSNINMNQLKIQGKGSKERTIPLDRAFWAAMKPYLDWADRNPKTEYLVSYVIRGRAHSYTPKGISGMIKTFARKMGMHFTCHTFRRSFGRHLYKRNCPLGELRVLMGHKSLETTIKYLGIGDYDIQDAMTYRPDYLGNKSGKTVPSERRPV